jgi:putative component of toxin-antitoxin plasmid stabilization module
MAGCLRKFNSNTIEVLDCFVRMGIQANKIGQKVVILLAGGDKNSQSKDIKTALRLSRNS